jgi:hypothetical protein
VGVAGTVSINNANRTVLVTVPLDTNLKGTLTPDIDHDGVDIYPASDTGQTFAGDTAYTPVTYTVTAEDGSTADWTVMVRLAPAGTTVAEITGYLGGTPIGSGTQAEPYFLPVSLNLADTGGNGWAALLSAIPSGKYVALDLSACTGMTVFDPNAADTDTGRVAAKGKIVSLVLPDGATGVKAGTNSDPTFKNFTALESVTGAGIQTVGKYAFYNCDALESISLPAAKSTGVQDFYLCTGLETVNLPAATSIGENAFRETGTKDLTVTLGSTVPTLGDDMFNFSARTVTVKVPNGVAAWNGKTGMFTGTNTTSNWGNGFRGGGWNGSSITDSNRINSNITLTVTDAP